MSNSWHEDSQASHYSGKSRDIQDWAGEIKMAWDVVSILEPVVKFNI